MRAILNLLHVFINRFFGGRRKPLYAQYGRAALRGKRRKPAGFSGAGQRKFQMPKPAPIPGPECARRDGYRCGGLPAASASPLSRLKRMDMSRVTPRSCIVTPYIVRAADIVRLLWEITRNCE